MLKVLRNAEPSAALGQALHVPVEVTDRTAYGQHRLEQSVAVLQAAILGGDARAVDAVDEALSDHGACSSAASSPRAFALVSSSSGPGRESATMPPPVRNVASPALTISVRIRMFRSSEPSSPR